ncbi:MAG TPA: Gfo/Idh/MocA family oxidoreductase, partial [bacterium]|nr:Gfo/Idh/MocA family oxidoreductase [bacterium]
MIQKIDPKNDRRHFLKTSATALAAAQLMGTGAWAGANEKVRVAVVGVHGQGRTHIRKYLEINEAELVALCDVDQSVLDKACEELIVSKGFPKPKLFWNYRELLEDPSIDAVSFATPNHWHSLQAIWGCQAGKHVYVEKPLSHNIWEGRQLVKAARKYNRIVQHGTNSRSSDGVREAVRLLREGVIGDVYMAKGLCYKWRDTIGHTPDEPVPPGVHYDQWIGPAPERPFSRNRFHYNWHWQWP